MVVTRTIDTIIQNLINNLKLKVPTASTAQNSVIREALINGPATELAFLNDAADRIQNLQLIAEASGTDLDNLVANYGIVRLGGTRSTGFVFIILDSLASGATITVSSGTIVSTKGTDSNITTTRFEVLGNYNFTSSQLPTYESIAEANRALFAQAGFPNVRAAASIPIRCLDTGTTGNVSAYTIVNGNIAGLGNSTGGIPNFINLLPTRGGQPSESDHRLRRRASLVFVGNNVGSEGGLTATILSNPSAEAVFIVTSGSPLMTRDGSEFDSNGNLIKEGIGRDVDIYVKGSTLEITTQETTYSDTRTDKSVAIDMNTNITLGVVDVDATSGNRPIVIVDNVIGSQSGLNFVIGQDVTDDEGNVIVEGDVFLLKDIEASNYSIVKNATTNELKLARSLSSTSHKYVVVQALESTDFANSTKGNDSLVFLTRTATILDELLTRNSTFNGADSLAFPNAITLNEISQETAVVETLIIENSGFVLNTKLTPIISVTSIINARQGTALPFEITNLEAGEITLQGRHAPQKGDALIIQYQWKHTYIPNVEAILAGDTIDWLVPNDEKAASLGSSLLGSTALKDISTVSAQPSLPSQLRVNTTGLKERSRYDLTITGPIAEIIEQEQVSFTKDTANNYTFSIPTISEGSRIGRVTKLTNATTQTEYSLIGYTVGNNEFDIGANTDGQLSNNTFIIDQSTNQTTLSAGDRITLGQRTAIRQYTSQSDFTNNLTGQALTPTYDPLKINIPSTGALELKTLLTDVDTTPQFISGNIVSDTIWSGLIELIDDVDILAGITLTIQPNTVIRVRPSSQLVNNVNFNDVIQFSERAFATGDILLVGSNDGSVISGGSVLTDTSVDFISSGVQIGDVIVASNTIYTVINVIGITQVQVYPQFNITTSALTYNVFRPRGILGVLATENLYSSFFIYRKPVGATADSFLINDVTFLKELRIKYDIDIIRRTEKISFPGQFDYYLNNTLIDSGFYPVIEQTFDRPQGLTVPRATLLGGYRNDSVVEITSTSPFAAITNTKTVFVAFIDSGETTYIIPLSNPVALLTGDPAVDISILDFNNSALQITGFSYESPLNSVDITSAVTSDIYSGVDGNIANLSDQMTSALSDFNAAGVVVGDQVLINGELYTVQSVVNNTTLQLDRTTTPAVVNQSFTIYRLYKAKYFSSQPKRIAINVHGTLITPSASLTPEESLVIFTSAATLTNTMTTDDWEGIRFRPESRSTSTNGVSQSVLSNVEIRYARKGVHVDTSNPITENCYILDCFEEGINIISSNESLTKSLGTYVAPTTLGIENIFSIGDNLITALNEMPNFDFIEDDIIVIGSTGSLTNASTIFVDLSSVFVTDGVQIGDVLSVGTSRFTITQVVSETQLVIAPASLVTQANLAYTIFRPDRSKISTGLVHNTDYTVLIETDNGTVAYRNIETQLGLIPDVDFTVQYRPQQNGYVLVIFGTANVVANLDPLLTPLVGDVSITYNAPISAGVVTNNQIYRCGVGIALGSIAETNITNNTIHDTSEGIVVDDAIALIANNIVSDYSLVPVRQSKNALVSARRNDFYSKTIEDQFAISTIDVAVLLQDVDLDTITLPVSNPLKFSVASIIVVDSEQMLVQGIGSNTIVVRRGYQGTTNTSHKANSIIEIKQLNVIFTINNIPGTNVEFIKSNSVGVLDPRFVPVRMRAVGTNSWRAAIPVKRGQNFYYIYRYRDINGLLRTTGVRTLSSIQPGNGVNDLYNPIHEILSNDSTNFSQDPLYTNEAYNNFDLEVGSAARMDSTIYGSLLTPNPIHRYVGTDRIIESSFLGTAVSTITISNNPLITTNLGTDVVVTGPTGTGPFTVTSFDSSTGVVTFTPATSVIGTYRARYDRPVNLGSSISSNRYRGLWNVIFQQINPVDFTQIKFSRDDNTGGAIRFRYRIADDTSLLSSAVFSNTFTTQVIDITANTTNIRGRVIEVEAQIVGNDSSYSDNTYVTPVLEDFSITYTPARDSEQYIILGADYNTISNKTTVVVESSSQPGFGILNTTFNTVGADNLLDVYKIDRVSGEQSIIALSQGVVGNQTELEILGDITKAKVLPATFDKVYVSYIKISDTINEVVTSEVLTFLQEGEQITQNRFARVDGLSIVATQDDVALTLTNEAARINSMNQPEGNTTYLVDYKFEAPIEGETLTIEFIYNSLIPTLQAAIDQNKEVVADVLVKQGIEIPVTIAITLTTDPLLSTNSIVSSVSAAISDYIAGIQQFAATITVSDIIKVAKSINGVIDVTVNTLNKTGESGVANTIIFSQREYPSLAVGSPTIARS